MSRAHQLAEHVELELSVGRIADPHGFAAVIARKPVGAVFGQPLLTVHAVHNLQSIRIARDGAQQPVAPGKPFVIVSAVKKCEEREGGIPDPAVAIIPIALAAD